VATEAFTNAAKHANASTVDILIERADGTLTVQVRDDGVGGANTARGSGLIGLRDRVEAVGGTMTVDSPAGAGTVLTARLPVTTEDHLSERTMAPPPARYEPTGEDRRGRAYRLAGTGRLGQPVRPIHAGSDDSYREAGDSRAAGRTSESFDRCLAAGIALAAALAQRIPASWYRRVRPAGTAYTCW
jgi:hypothetical protein